MKSLQKTYQFSMLMSILTLFIQCATSQNTTDTKKQTMNQSQFRMEEKAPVAFDQPYFQEWVAGIEEGGSGFNVILPIKETPEVELKEVYFQGKKIDLTFNPNSKRYSGNYKHSVYKKKDMVMSNDPKKEYGNQLPVIEKPIPFTLENNEAVVSYMDGNVKKYFKITGITKKRMMAFPEAPPRDKF
ncbi:hypothetical protein NBT05_04140 [Aquimarina sp. ERC-38]|uniref:hypothetical protein n=1 Tax=Aquimarina sp. ERC-38 TaxID=2949996 RepID=UPI00224847BE|nr:hypothetical protein [Aquimarina sp. ERC-38]UZO81665.1 hypothetical protein NBT05_04140 [Aquimarina sp. ERC-38]